ncbi:MAG: undecaprenyl/decaprenyl-phosphate alpha-N-acetylglucosaminyl 1-phosphate transferase [Deltaproteobacteria bacterium]|nr:undecaprenyl/decaprenyl-phosphate alpha-N-acetylglucosaminyl 1-phosphate transferase [Deltaproteobacteria bacterium]MBW2117688.1 undecaprenyl/decaprenyl-phosphate alpha-N-acetylglucosaminyl 1-phosphate transferase [Deltaproteobacteria bacterium]
MFGNKKISPLRIFYPPCIILFLILIIPYLRRYFTDVGLRWLYIFLFSFALSFILTPVFGWIARRFNILDIPNERKIHTNNTPLLGGAAIMISFCASLTANMILEMETIALLLGGLIVGVIGILDDWRGMSAKLKLIIQICVVLMLIYNGIILDLFPIKTTWGYIANSVLTVIWIVGITNAMNFFDGMDGLATGLSAIIALFIGIVSFQTNQPFMGWIAIAIVGSCLGFLPFNFRLKKPAAIFLGDAGSTFLGFILAGLAIKGYWADNRPIVSFATPILIFWILIFDMTYITVERIITGKVKTVKEWIDYVGTDHLHHRLYALLGDKRKAVLTIFLLSATLGLSSIALRNARMIDAIILVCQAFLIAIIVSVIEYAGRNKG